MFDKFRWVEIDGDVGFGFGGVGVGFGVGFGKIWIGFRVGCKIVGFFFGFDVINIWN